MATIDSPLNGKSVVIIGGSSGIGFAVAEQVIALGAQVILGSTTGEKVKAAAGKLSGARGLTLDLRDQNSIAKFFAEIGRFDHLAITAGDWGSPMYTPTQHIDVDAVRDLFSVRFWGALSAVKTACDTIAEDGSITLTSGVLPHRSKGAPMITAMSGAIEHLTRGLAVDLAPLRVNVVSPGSVLTDNVPGEMPGEMIQGIVGGLPLSRAARPAEAARAYIYLMTNAYVTGQILPIDRGGMLVFDWAPSVHTARSGKSPRSRLRLASELR